ncbi:MAG: ROK family protein [Pirellulales bacterium]
MVETTDGEIPLPEAKKYWIGFDLGGTKMQGVICDLDLRPLARIRKKTRGTDGAKSGMERIGDIIEKLLEEVGGSIADIAGIGIGCPGPVEWETGVVRIAVNLGWKNAPVGPTLSARFDCPVQVLNDVDAGVYGGIALARQLGLDARLGSFLERASVVDVSTMEPFFVGSCSHVWRSVTFASVVVRDRVASI